MPTGKYMTKKGERWFFEIDLPKEKNGKRHRIKERGFLTEKEAKKAERQKLHEIDTGTFIEPSKQLYKQYLAEWLEQKRDLGRQTRENYKSNIELHINDILGNIKLSELHQTDIQNFVNHLYTKPHQTTQPKDQSKQRAPKIGLAPSTVKRIYNIVHASLEDALQLGLVNRNVAAKIPHKPKITQEELRVWDDEQINQFLTWAKGRSRFWIAYFLAMLTGCRQGEVLGLRWKDIDFEKGCLFVRQTLSHDGTYFKQPKTRKSIRPVALSPKTIEVLQAHKLIIEAEKAKAGEDYTDLDLVVCTSKGTPATPRNVMKQWRKLVNKCGLPYVSYHSLRHSHASLLFKSGKHSPKLVSIRLGHSSTRITQDIYTHMLPNMQEDAANELDDLLF